MDAHVQKQLEALCKTDPEAASLVREHRALDEQVTDLYSRSHLTPEEDVELHRLKKEKLLLKDRIEMLIQQKKSA